MKYSFLPRLLAAVLPLMWCGCFVSTISLNHGKLLNPGEGMISAGVGVKRADMVKESGSFPIMDSLDTISYRWLSFCFDYRLGLLSKYPFGKGAEIGLHIEEAFSKEHDTITSSFYQPERGYYDSTYITWHPLVQGPPQVEFTVRLGLPDAVLSRSIMHHNIEAGWIVGGWVDNGWFLGYAASAEFRRIMPYGGLRITLNPTNVLERSTFFEDSTFFTDHNRSWHLRFTAGSSLILPRLPALPDFISPEISLLAPGYGLRRKVGISFGMGLRWMNGI